MALVNPNIAMSFRQPEFQAPNALAQFAQIQQIQGGQQAQELARYQLGAAQRAEATQNALADAYSQSIDPDTGAINYNKLTGLLAKGGGGSQIPGIEKTRRELETAALTKRKLEQDIETGVITQKNTQSQIDERNFGLQDKKLKFAWNAVGDAATPEAAIAELTKGAATGIFDMKSVTADIQRLQRMTTPEQYRQYRAETMFKIVDAKDKLNLMLPKVARQDVGGQIQTIQDNPMLPGYGQPIAGANLPKTRTFADITAEKNLGVSQGQFGLAREKFKFDQTNANQAVTYQQDANGDIVAFPTKVKAGEIPRGVAVVAPGPGMLPMKGKPSEAAAKETASLNQQNAIIKGALEEIKKNPGAFGTARGLAGGVLGETFGARIVGETPEETQARSFLFNVVSGVIKERAGTAQSAGEQATLDRFLPTTKDDAEELTAKLKGFQTYLKARESAGKKPGGTPPPTGVDTSNPLLK
jgi:hypothetical protein